MLATLFRFWAPFGCSGQLFWATCLSRFLLSKLEHMPETARKQKNVYFSSSVNQLLSLQSDPAFMHFSGFLMVQMHSKKPREKDCSRLAEPQNASVPTCEKEKTSRYTWSKHALCPPLHEVIHGSFGVESKYVAAKENQNHT